MGMISDGTKRTRNKTDRVDGLQKRVLNAVS